MTQPLEIEIKYLITDPTGLRKTITDLGWTSEGKYFEYNIRFEDENEGLYQKRQLLRLRKDNKNILTFKSKSNQKSEFYKIRREIEVTVSDFEAMRSIIRELGFRHEQIYEKWRETFRVGPSVICLDHMPFGHFMEIEGPEDDITTLSNTLGFSPLQGIKANYLTLFSFIKKKAGLPFNDVTFEHFKTVSIDFTNDLRSFETGSAQ